MQQNVRRNVVGQIPNHIQGLVCLSKLTQVHGQHIRLDNLDLRLFPKTKPKLRCQSPVQLHSDKPLRARRQNVGNRSMPRPNLDHLTRTHIPQRVGNTLPRLVIHQKILPKLRLPY